jgi:hypothetical protein
MSLLSPKINKGFMTMVDLSEASPRAKIVDGHVAIGTVVNITSIDGQYLSDHPGHDYFEAIFSFEGCNEKITAVNFTGTSLFDGRATATSYIPSMGMLVDNM